MQNEQINKNKDAIETIHNTLNTTQLEFREADSLQSGRITQLSERVGNVDDKIDTVKGNLETAINTHVRAVELDIKAVNLVVSSHPKTQIVKNMELT